MDPIVIAEQNTNLNQTQDANVFNWTFTPPEFLFFWIMSYPIPPAFSNTIKFPDYSDQFPDHTDWKFNVEMEYLYYYFFNVTNVAPFCKVEGGTAYEGTLGVLADGFYTKTLNFTFFNLNLLSAAQYYAKANCKVSAVNPVTGLREEIATKTLNIGLNAITSNLYYQFEVAFKGKVFNPVTQLYNPLTFTYHLGDALPSAKEVYYFEPGNFALTNLIAPSVLTISDAIVLASYIAIHPFFAKMLISFDDISAFAPGTYDYSVVIGRAGAGPEGTDLTKTIPIQLFVFEASTPDFYTDPEELTFDVSVGQLNFALFQTFFIYSQNPWFVVGEVPNWLILSAYNGVATEQITVNINYENLEVGVYSFPLVISDGTTEITITITLNLSAFLTHPFVPNKLFFTRELDFLKFSSGNNNTYVEIDLEIKVFNIKDFEELIYLRTYNLPLAAGKGEFHIGEIVHQLFDELKSLDSFFESIDVNLVSPGYLPAEVKVSYEEKLYADIPGIELTSGEIETFKMILGHKPYITESNLCLLNATQQDLTTITPKSIVCVPFAHFGNPKILVKKNNILIEEFEVNTFPSGSSPQKMLYNYFRFFNDLNPGDLLEILIVNNNEVRTSCFLTLPEGLSSTHVLFENSNGMIDSLELRGRRKIGNEYSFDKYKKLKNKFEIEKKSDTKLLQSVIVNSGHLGDSDFRKIDQLMKSDKIWINFNSIFGKWIQVDSITTKMNVDDTFSNDSGINIEFNLLENSYAAVYPE